MSYVDVAALAGTGLGQGAEMVGFIQPVLAAVARTAMDKARDTVSVKDFGATGDGVTDDRAAIQEALDWLGKNGGGTVLLPKPQKHYRIEAGLRIPSYVTLAGDCGNASYPFNAGADGSISIVAAFADPMQWVIEAATTEAGSPIAYNTVLSPNLPEGRTFNCGVRDLMVTCVGTIPYGGIRMHGCPGALIENVAVLGVSMGIFVNCSFGARVVAHLLVQNYGAVFHNANACRSDLYITGTQPGTHFVPAAYIPAFLGDLQGSLTTVLQLEGADHWQRKWGIYIGSSESTSTGNAFTVRCIEKFSGGIFQRYSYGTTILGPYLEGDPSDVDYGLVASNSRYVATGVHAYFGGSPAKLFDHGVEVVAECFITGIPLAGFGHVAAEPNSRTVLRLIAPTFGPAAPQFNVLYPDFNSAPVDAALAHGWVDADTDLFNKTLYYRTGTGRVRLQGRIKDGAVSSTAFVLDPGFRPYRTCDFAVPDGAIRILASGEVIPMGFGGGAEVSLDGIEFDQAF